jgi:tetratricopeptide (TPR) repeat protein
MGSEEMLERAIVAVEAGRREEARDILVDALALDPACLEAWLRLADLATTPERALLYFERALQIAPQSLRAQKGLEEARARLQGGGGPLERGSLEEPLAAEAPTPEGEQPVDETFAPPSPDLAEVAPQRERPLITSEAAAAVPRQRSIFIADDHAPFSLDLSVALGEADQPPRPSPSSPAGGESPEEPS